MIARDGKVRLYRLDRQALSIPALRTVSTDRINRLPSNL